MYYNILQSLSIMPIDNLTLQTVYVTLLLVFCAFLLMHFLVVHLDTKNICVYESLLFERILLNSLLTSFILTVLRIQTWKETKKEPKQSFTVKPGFLRF